MSRTTNNPPERPTRKDTTMSDSDPQRIHPHTPPTSQETAMTTTPQRIDEIRDRLNKARPGLAEIDGGEEILKRRGNLKGSYTWTLYGTYADAILLVNARNDIAWLLGEVERLSAERMQPEQADPTDAEIWAAAEESEYHEQWDYDENGFPHCECGASLVESEHDLGVVPSVTVHQAREVLLAARKAARHE